MGLYSELIQHLKERRQNILDGNVNCIPSPFKRFNEDYVGVEKGFYYLVSANQKVGKTQITNYLFVYSPILYAYKHREQVKVKIYYYNLEESKENITLRFISFLLYTFSKGQLRISTKDLKSTRKEHVLDERILQILQEEPYKSIMEFYEECIEFREERNPTGIQKSIEDFCKDNGRIEYVEKTISDKITGEEVKINVFDKYIPNDDRLYFIPIVDHISLISPEMNLTLKQSMDKLSAYLVKDRNRYNISPVVVQQQAAASESTENFKLNKLRPTAIGLSDTKYTARDCSMMIGLFAPVRHDIREYFGYDVTRLKDHLRFMEIVVNREGEQNGICPLFFDGACNAFFELPKPSDEELNKFYEKAQKASLVNVLIKKRRKLWQTLQLFWENLVQGNQLH